MLGWQSLKESVKLSLKDVDRVPNESQYAVAVAITELANMANKGDKINKVLVTIPPGLGKSRIIYLLLKMLMACKTTF